MEHIEGSSSPDGIHLDLKELEQARKTSNQPSPHLDISSQGSESDIHLLSISSSDQLQGDGGTPTGNHFLTDENLFIKDNDAKSSALKALAGIGKVVSKSRRIDAEALQAIKAQRARSKAEGGPNPNHRHSRTLSSDSLPSMSECLAAASLPSSQYSTSTGATTPPYPTLGSRGHRRSHSGIPFPPPSPINTTNASYSLTTSHVYSDWLSSRTLPELLSLQSAVETEISKHLASNSNATPPQSTVNIPTPPPVDAMLSAHYTAALASIQQQQQQKQHAEHAAALQQALAAVTSMDSLCDRDRHVSADMTTPTGAMTPTIGTVAATNPTAFHMNINTQSNSTSPLRQNHHQQQHNNNNQQLQQLSPESSQFLAESISFQPNHSPHHQRSHSHHMPSSTAFNMNTHGLHHTTNTTNTNNNNNSNNNNASNMHHHLQFGTTTRNIHHRHGHSHTSMNSASSMTQSPPLEGTSMLTSSGLGSRNYSSGQSTNAEFSFLGDFPSLDVSGISAHTASLMSSAMMPSALHESTTPSLIIPKTQEIASPFNRAALSLNSTYSALPVVTTTSSTAVGELPSLFTNMQLGGLGVGSSQEKSHLPGFDLRYEADINMANSGSGGVSAPSSASAPASTPHHLSPYQGTSPLPSSFLDPWQ